MAFRSRRYPRESSIDIQIRSYISDRTPASLIGAETPQNEKAGILGMLAAVVLILRWRF